MATLPIISLDKLKRLNRTGVRTTDHQRLHDICHEHGFFYLTEHGISPTLVDRTISASRSFFQLPTATKAAYRQENQPIAPFGCRGYIPPLGEVLQHDGQPDLKEVFDLGVDRPPSSKPFIGRNYLPEDSVARDFADAHYALQEGILTTIVPPLLSALAVALEQPPDWFTPHFKDPVLIQRAIYYPPHSSGAGKHTDNGIFTVLIQEELPSPSLRVHTKDQWIDAECIQGAFVINLGDMLQIWTNGRFVSTPHEVIHQLPCSRVSLPFFVYPSIDAIIEPLGTKEKHSVAEIMLKNFDSIWVQKAGAGRARELVGKL